MTLFLNISFLNILKHVKCYQEALLYRVQREAGQQPLNA